MQVFALEHLGGCYQYQIIQTMGIYRLRKNTWTGCLIYKNAMLISNNGNFDVRKSIYSFVER